MTVPCKAVAVIGAGYGDEGKGRMVDHLARQAKGEVVVVRTNGGAQAAHTVVTPEGVRHVFSHVGSGALAGAATHLSADFVSHPILLYSEWARLRRIGACLGISSDPRGLMTTPWDMMLNQALEMGRGGDRHGSCGVGFGETVGRVEETPFDLHIADLFDVGLRSKLHAIRDEWFPWRANAIGVDLDAPSLSHWRDEGILEAFEADCARFAELVTLRHDSSLGEAQQLIFEGAQGLRLDQRSDDFPHVTRSNTGLANIVRIAREAELRKIEVSYVTRCYATRHGAGPMRDERDLSPWFAVDDPTNTPNAWQGALRFGLLDIDGTATDLNVDIRTTGGLDVTARLAVTCLDQTRDGRCAWISGAKVVEGSQGDFVSALLKTTGIAAATTFTDPGNEPGVDKMHYAS